MNIKQKIWIWERIVSPHMAGLAAALARSGCDVVYVAEEEISSTRKAQGWTRPNLGDASLKFASNVASINALVERAPSDSIHICQGVRSNGYVGKAQRALARRGLRQWAMMETVHDSGVIGALKRGIYRLILTRRNRQIEGVLAIGKRTPDWIAARGFSADRVFPFAYYLSDIDNIKPQPTVANNRFRFLYVGQFIRRKRVDMLIRALSEIKHLDFELVIIGSGPIEQELNSLAKHKLLGHVKWMGRLPMQEAHREILQADCLVLPSRNDGWGAVVSEALMRGTPAIVSDECGSSVAVEASGVGGVFLTNDQHSLRAQLCRAIDDHRPSAQKRIEIANWAKCLGAEEGANYFLRIAKHVYYQAPLPAPTWESSN